MSTTQQGRGPRRAALTLVELLLGLLGTALLALAIVSIFFAWSHGSDSGDDLRTLVGKQALIDARLGTAIRASSKVLEKGSDFMVLWMADYNDSTAPDLSEIRLLEYDAGTSEIISYKAPADLDPADDAEYGLNDDFETITGLIKGGANFPATMWGTQVAGWSISLDDPVVKDSSLVSYRVTIEANRLNTIIVGAAPLHTQ